ncbi:penicillin acylase family protein [Pseudonocardia phyllosphaerae]|uniref:penicillin acylase family protein n=1 Tax=Pseudonocardia phyllosphaerae TaxID=3390502 RepID=UPI00397987A7
MPFDASEIPPGTPEEQLPVAGLGATVEVLVDAAGVPHHYAASGDDLYRAQGFTIARERLFQLDLWRRRGLGRLAEVYGERFVARDRAARLFLYRGDMHAEWLAYGDATKRIVTAFVGGINAFIDVCEQEPERLPLEFRELGFQPGRWAPADVVRVRSHGLYYNVEQEIERVTTLRDLGPEAEDLRQAREPAHTIRVPEGLDLAAFPEDPSVVLDDFRLATSWPVFDGEDPAPDRDAPEGSNNWAVGASRTATGRPLLAGDPHRAIDLPSMRYITHLSAPGVDIIGAGEPALPGVAMGHNGNVAFALTIFGIDMQDLYVYETEPGNPTFYRYRDGWEPMTVVTETVPVAGGEPVEVELRFTRHGPVVWADPERRTAFAVRAAWLEPGMAPYLSSLAYQRAETPDDYVDALNRWGAPGLNHVYAAPDGTIGWRPAGLVPIRPNWDGTLPVPGDGRYEWDGFYDVDRLPSLRDPECDWVATANQMNLPDDHDNAEHTVGYDWLPGFRYARIAEVLGSATDVSIAACEALQRDTVDVAARRLLQVLDEFVPGPDVADAVAMLRGWDCDETTDSAAAALYQVWSRAHLRPELLRNALADRVAPEDLETTVERFMPGRVALVDTRTTLEMAAALTGERTVLDEILTRSLRAAVDDLRSRLGETPELWRWGALHLSRPQHPLAGRLSDERVAVPPVERGGGPDTVMQTAFDDTYVQTSGASFSMVIDVGDWDNSRAVNAPGQSGRPEDDHYRDLLPRWAAGDTFPLHYSRSAVERHTVLRLLLVPSGPR